MREKYDRVTSIISPFTGIEFVKDEILKPACARGSLVHEYVERDLHGFNVDVKDGLNGYFKSYKLFWEKYKHIYDSGDIILEKRLYCDEWKITGQIDVIIKCPDRTYLIDWKTSANEHKTSFMLQAAAYKYLAKVNGFKNVDNALFVRLKKDGKSPVLNKYEDYEKDLTTFQKCLELYRYFSMSTTRRKNE